MNIEIKGMHVNTIIWINVRSFNKRKIEIQHFVVEVLYLYLFTYINFLFYTNFFFHLHAYMIVLRTVGNRQQPSVLLLCITLHVIYSDISALTIADDFKFALRVDIIGICKINQQIYTTRI